MLIAALAGVPVQSVGRRSLPRARMRRAGTAQRSRRSCLGPFAYSNPFTGEAMSLAEAVRAMCFLEKS